MDRRDWGLWATAITILFLLCFAVFSLTLPTVRTQDEWLINEHIAIGVRGLLALVLLFSVFVVYQQHLIKSLRAKLHQQIAVVTDLHSRAETFERLSILDPLTGLFNRRFAYDYLPREMARAERTGQPLIVIIIDLDQFKQVNDTLGHAGGDAALEAFSRHLKRAIRSVDLPVRMGGDEFLVALPDCTVEQADGPLKRMYGCELDYEGKHVQVNFSVGVVEHRRGESVGQLLERGDAEMYKNKGQISDSPRDWLAHRRGRELSE